MQGSIEVARELVKMARRLVSMTLVKRCIENDEENRLRREYDELAARGETSSRSFDSWMLNVKHYRYDRIEKKYYNIEEA